METWQSKELLQRVDNCSNLHHQTISKSVNPWTGGGGVTTPTTRPPLDNKTSKLTFFVILGIVPLWNPFLVFHSIPSGTSIRRSNCALLVYGNGKSLTRYFSAFLSFFSEMITCDLPASWRFDGSIPGKCLMRSGLGGGFVRPAPPQEP